MKNKVLICYGSRYGTTTEIVQDMKKTAEDLGVKVDTVFLKKEKPPSSFDEFDLVIIGSGIQAGRWTKDPLNFIKNNIDSLSKTKVALFAVCAYAGDPERRDEAQTRFLDDVIEKYPGFSPISTALIGGAFEFEKYNFAVRKIVKTMGSRSLPPGEKMPEKIDFRDWDQIRGWINEIVQ
ncbi:MAG: flavodoxin domain-containing protein [Candidatus Thorarchaeota archaeon]